MSYAKHRARRDRRIKQTREVKMLRNNIRRGIMPAFHLAKEVDGGNFLERKLVSKSRRKLTWRQVGTFQALMALPEVKNDSENNPQDSPSSPQSA